MISCIITAFREPETIGKAIQAELENWMLREKGRISKGLVHEHMKNMCHALRKSEDDLFDYVHEQVPEILVDKAPSAGLWEGQTDEKEIGVSYPELDSILFLHLEKGFNAEEIISWGIEKSKVEKVLRMMKYSQHKRNPLARPNPRL